MTWEDATPAPLHRITPVLGFVGASWPLFSPPNEFEGVRLESERSIKRLLTRPGDLDSTEIERFTRLLAPAFSSK